MKLYFLLLLLLPLMLISMPEADAIPPSTPPVTPIIVMDHNYTKELKEGDTITFTGKVTNLGTAKSSLSRMLTNPEGLTLGHTELPVNPDGTFSESILLKGNRISNIIGEYEVFFSYDARSPSHGYANTHSETLKFYITPVMPSFEEKFRQLFGLVNSSLSTKSIETQLINLNNTLNTQINYDDIWYNEIQINTKNISDINKSDNASKGKFKNFKVFINQNTRDLDYLFQHFKLTRP